MGRRSSIRILSLRCAISIVLLSGVLAAPATAQAPFIGPPITLSSRFELSDSVQIADVPGGARTSLESVRAFTANENWDDAIETLRQVQQQYGDQLMPLDDDRYITLRDYCHLQIAKLPPPALQLYRQRVDPQAEQWFTQARQSGDETLLRRIVEQFYCSSRGDDAMLLLGEHSLERGDSLTARRWWQQISPLTRGAGGAPAWIAVDGYDLAGEESLEVLSQFTSRDAAPRWLAYPDTDLSLAEVRARLALVSIFADDTQRAATEVALLEQLHPLATGRLGGKQVDLAEFLRTMLADSATWPAIEDPAAWPTFAKNNARNAVVERPLEYFPRPTWTAPLLTGSPVEDDFPEAEQVRLDALAPSIHPIIAGEHLFYSNGRQVFALELHTGKPAWSDRDGFGQIYPSGLNGEEAPFIAGVSRSSIKSLGHPRHTITSSGELLFARLGSPITSRPADNAPARDGSFLVCLDLNKQGALRWRYPQSKDMPDFIEQGWAFEGAPLADGERLYVAMRRSDVRPQSHVACFRIDNGELLWRRMVASADTPASTHRNEITHNLLTLHEGILYVNTNLGAVAALQSEGGEPLWVHRYERVKSGEYSRLAAHFRRDTNPCVVAHDMVFVGPADSESIFALDAATGMRVWIVEPTHHNKLHPVHILGVVDHHLIATGNNVWWFDVVGGSLAAVWPHGSGNTEEGYGRGVLSRNFVYWPTREEIVVYDAQPPRRHEVRLHRRIQLARPDLPIPLTGGNLLAGEGFALIVSRDRIFAFRQERSQDDNIDR